MASPGDKNKARVGAVGGSTLHMGSGEPLMGVGGSPTLFWGNKPGEAMSQRLVGRSWGHWL